MLYSVYCIYNTANEIYNRIVRMNVNHIKRKIDMERNTIQKCTRFTSNKLCCKLKWTYYLLYMWNVTKQFRNKVMQKGKPHLVQTVWELLANFTSPLMCFLNIRRPMPYIELPLKHMMCGEDVSSPVMMNLFHHYQRFQYGHLDLFSWVVILRSGFLNHKALH